MGSIESDAETPRPTQEEVEAVMLATRVLIAVTAQSVASVEDRVTLPQLRVLVMIASRGPQNLASVAQALGVHPSNATRRCDRLVEAGLIHRSDDPADRRNLILRLTPSGRELVLQMTERRRAAIENVLAKMPASLRGDLVPALRAFAQAAGEVPPSEAWALGWTTDRPNGTPHHMPSGTTC
ncbi:MAG TPA: MarR family transcriptional regulator [Pseudonocardiaceae bacterium]|jgi:DNA-binding MarR family transcriptional regulator|nr:MarR family transcriptional regulator [Pseudonocardiaceae bacterium]